MRAIWKYPLAMTGSQVVSVPEGAQTLEIQVQRGQPCVWALVDPEAPKGDVEVRIHGTGHPIPDNLDDFLYLGTFQLEGGALVFHAFARDVDSAMGREVLAPGIGHPVTAGVTSEQK